MVRQSENCGTRARQGDDRHSSLLGETALPRAKEYSTEAARLLPTHYLSDKDVEAATRCCEEWPALRGWGGTEWTVYSVAQGSPRHKEEEKSGPLVEPSTTHRLQKADVLPKGSDTATEGEKEHENAHYDQQDGRVHRQTSQGCFWERG